MEIVLSAVSTSTSTPPSTNSTSAAAQTAPTQVSLSVGQQLAATVAAVNADGDITLIINNLVLSAKTELALVAGQLLNLIVTQKGDQIQLLLSDAANKEQVIAQALRQDLPRQLPLTEILSNLSFLVKQSGALRDALPAAVIELAQQIIRQTPNSTDVSRADSLKDSVRQVGVFLEQKLKEAVVNQSAPDVTRDLKAALLQLRSALQTLERPTSEQKAGNLPAETAEAATFSASAAVKASADNSGRPQKAGNPLDVVDIRQSATDSSKDVSKSVSAALSGAEVTGGRLARALLSPLPTPSDAEEIIAPTRASNIRDEGRTGAAYVSSREKGVNESALPGGGVQAQAKVAATLDAPGLLPDPVAELLKQVEGALARTQLHQLATLAEQDHGRLLLSFDLPVRHNERTDVIQMHIERDARRSEHDTDLPTTVTLGFDIEPLGPMYARVTLLKENVSVMLWAERAETAQLFGSHLADLRARLEKNGLKADNLAAHVGSPAQKFVRLGSRSLVDVQA